MEEILLPKPKLETPKPDWDFENGYRLAMIIDGVVHGILYLAPGEAAKYLSEPKFVQIPKTLHVEKGFKYDGKNFSVK